MASIEQDYRIYERIAKIEVRLDQLDDIEEKVNKLDTDLARYRGLVGGVLLVITAIGTFLKLFGASIKEYFTAAIS